VGLTLAAKEALALAEGQAARSLAESVTVGHLLVALAMLPTTAAGRALASLGVTSASVREVIAQVVDETPASGEAPPDAPETSDPPGAPDSPEKTDPPAA
jgi:hypothetical protein